MIKMSFKLKSTGIETYRKNLGRLSQVVGKAAADVEGEAKASILKNSGKYKQYGNHWSSPPGSPPNSDTGFLANSIQHKMLTATSAEVTVNAKYAVPLELGWISANGNHVPARPFLRPAVEYVAPSFQAACKVILKGGK
jgi:phage gpG-like protein